MKEVSHFIKTWQILYFCNTLDLPPIHECAVHYSASLQALFRYPANPATVAGAYEAISYRQLSAMARLVKRMNLARRSENAPFAKFSSSLHVAVTVR